MQPAPLRLTHVFPEYMVLSTADNMAIRANRLAWTVVEQFRERLPPGWSVRLRTDGPDDAVVDISAPGASTRLHARIVSTLTPRAARELGTRAGAAPELVIARFLTPATRERLRDARVAHVDSTGNAYVVLRKPALFIETTGARTDPTPTPKGASLKGAKAGAVVRALCDFAPPVGVRELAERANVTPGYASRLVKLLTEEALLEREQRGPVLTVDVPRLLRRWSEHYSFTETNETRMYLDARGPSNALARLASRGSRYAVTGSFGAAGLAPIAAPRLLFAFVDNLDQAAEELGIRPADKGANVMLAEPFDPVVYARAWQKDGVTYAAPSQLVADLLTSPGRGPNEAEDLLRWMMENEDAWRVR